VAGIRHHRMAGLFRNWPCGPMRPNSLPQPRSSCLPPRSGPLPLAHHMRQYNRYNAGGKRDFLTDCPCLNPVGRLVSQKRGCLIWPQNIVYISEARGQRLIPGEGGGLSPPRPTSGSRIDIRGAIRLFSTQSPQVLHLVDMWLASACVLTDHPVHHQHQDDEVMTVRPRQRAHGPATRACLVLIRMRPVVQVHLGPPPKHPRPTARSVAPANTIRRDASPSVPAACPIASLPSGQLAHWCWVVAPAGQACSGSQQSRAGGRRHHACRPLARVLLCPMRSIS
jgi:hypothetical protein